MTATTHGMVATQVALVCGPDNKATTDWYRRMFGFLSAGSAEFGGADIAELQGLGVPDTKLGVAWLIDQNEFFQIELFKYLEPESKPLPAQRQLSDIGYGLVSIHVADFDATLGRLAAEGIKPVTTPLGAAGDRRVCVRDPIGNLLELMERDIRLPDAPPRLRPEVNVVVRSMTASVPDLARARQFFVDTLGMVPVDITLHGPEHEALWGLAGARRKTLTVVAGDLFVEVVEYIDPKPQAWPADHRVSDQGYMNFAIGARTPEPYRKTRARVFENGHHANCELLVPPNVEVSYAFSVDGFSVEMMYINEAVDFDFGFVPK